MFSLSSGETSIAANYKIYNIKKKDISSAEKQSLLGSGATKLMLEIELSSHSSECDRIMVYHELSCVLSTV